MRILLASRHRYPAVRGGIASARIHDWLARGLAELGHEVFYWLAEGAEEPLPDGVTLVAEPVRDVDIAHNHEPGQGPWVRSCHVDLGQRDGDPRCRLAAKKNWIFVSRSLAAIYGRSRFVLNGIDPAHYLYSEAKQDYVLFIARLCDGIGKGVEMAVSLAGRLGFELVVAGGNPSSEVRELMKALEGTTNIRFIGDVQGERKAALFAGARALLFPTRLNEGCPTVILEALMSGTPVICSHRGSCPELVSPDVGFVCREEEDYIRALEGIGAISPQACRARAMRDFHYLRMSRDYVREYERELGGSASCAWPSTEAIQPPPSMG